MLCGLPHLLPQTRLTRLWSTTRRIFRREARQYPTAWQLAKVQPEDITGIPFVTEEKAEKVLSTARKSVASQEYEDTGFALVHMAKKLLSLEEKIDGLKEQVDQSPAGE